MTHTCLSHNAVEHLTFSTKWIHLCFSNYGSSCNCTRGMSNCAFIDTVSRSDVVMYNHIIDQLNDKFDTDVSIVMHSLQ